MLNQELSYFISHQDELVQKYRGKVLVIKDQQVAGVYKNVLDAYLDSEKKHPLGTFLIQRCEPGPEAYTVTISTQSLFVDPA